MEEDSLPIIFMHQALLLAEQAGRLDEVPIGAVAVLNNEIVGSGFNCPITTNDPTAHAEIIALKEAAKKLGNYRLPDVTLYTTLEPCLMCTGAIVHARIKKLVFGTTDPKAGAIVSNFCPHDNGFLNHTIECCSGVLADKCSKILTDFFKAKR